MTRTRQTRLLLHPWRLAGPLAVALIAPAAAGQTDSDGDGLLDTWETTGIDFDGDSIIDLVLNGANPMRKDIYVEIDSMAVKTSRSAGFRRSRQAIEEARARKAGS